MVTVTGLDTTLVTMLNVADWLPAAIFTDGGTGESLLVEETETVSPPAGATPFKAIVPTAVPPPTIGFGATTTLSNVAGWT